MHHSTAYSAFSMHYLSTAARCNSVHDTKCSTYTQNSTKILTKRPFNSGMTTEWHSIYMSKSQNETDALWPVGLGTQWPIRNHRVIPTCSIFANSVGRTATQWNTVVWLMPTGKKPRKSGIYNHFAKIAGKSSSGLWLGLRRGGFTCVWWQVKLCDLIW